MKFWSLPQPGPPETLQLLDSSLPVPGPGEVLVKVACCTLTPLDVLMRQGRVPWLADKWPMTPGLEFGGIVTATGPEVDRAWIGRKVVSVSTLGGCAEYAVVPVRRLDRLHEALGWAVGVSWRTPTLTAWYALTATARVEKGQTVLIHSAAGAVGIMATQIAKQRGATVIGLAGSAAKLAYARPFGADALLDYSREAWVGEVMTQTGGRGVDVVIDGNGGGRAAMNYKLIAPNGRIVYLGATAGFPPGDVSIPLTIAKCFSVGGFNLNAIDETTLATDEAALATQLASGRLRFPLAERVPFADLPDLHRRFEARSLMGRSVLEVGETA